MPTENPQEDYKEIKFFILRGSLSDLSILDFSKYNVNIVKIDNPDFKTFIENHPSPHDPERNWELFKELHDEFKGFEQLYVLYPKNIHSQFNELDLLLCFEVILLLFPSDLSIYNIICFQVINKNSLHYCGSTEYDFVSTGLENYFDNFTYFDDNYINEINEFINLFKLRFKRIKYVKNALYSYLSSFRTATLDHAFLELCICLESIIEGSMEISYRIKHHVAMLCADNVDYAQIIFKNLNKIYSLRSKIIHGESYSNEKLTEYLPYLRFLVSRMIIEIILLNISDRSKLDNILTFSGFYKKPELSSDYKKMTLNITSFVKAFVKELN